MNHESRSKIEINEDTKIPLKIVWPLLMLTAAVVAGWFDVRSEMRSGFAEIKNQTNGMVTEKQFQTWTDDAREQNSHNSVVFPRLPEKKAEAAPVPMKVSQAEYDSLAAK